MFKCLIFRHRRMISAEKESVPHFINHRAVTPWPRCRAGCVLAAAHSCGPNPCRESRAQAAQESGAEDRAESQGA